MPEIARVVLVNYTCKKILAKDRSSVDHPILKLDGKLYKERKKSGVKTERVCHEYVTFGVLREPPFLDPG